MNKIKKFLSISLNTIGTQILMFLGISFMAKSQGVEFVGYQSFVFSVASYLLLVVQLGFQTQGLKLIVEGFRFRSLFISFTKVKLIIFLIILAILLAFVGYYPTEKSFGVLVVFVAGGFSLINSEYYLQYKERFFLIGISRLFAGCAFFLACIYIYLSGEIVVGGWVSLLPYSLFLLIPHVFLLYFYKEGLKSNRGLDFSIDKVVMNQSLIIALGALIVQIGYRIDKILISSYLGVYELGLYDTSYKFLNVALNVSFILYFVFAKNIKLKNIAYYHKIILIFLLCAILGCSSMYLLSPFLIETFFGANFRDSVDILRLLIVPLFFMVINVAMISPMNLFAMEKAYLLLVSISTILNFSVNVLLLDAIGVHGAVYAMAISEIFTTVLFLLFFYKKLKNKINNKEG